MKKGDVVRIKCNDEGYGDETGEIVEVFKSGRLMVKTGLSYLNLSQDEVVCEILDRHAKGNSEEENGNK